jgi:hypothetical protein
MVKINKDAFERMNRDYWKEYKDTHTPEEIAVEILKAHAFYTMDKDRVIHLISEELGDKAEAVFQNLVKSGHIELLANGMLSLPCVLSNPEDDDEEDE